VSDFYQATVEVTILDELVATRETFYVCRRSPAIYINSFYMILSFPTRYQKMLHGGSAKAKNGNLI